MLADDFCEQECRESGDDEGDDDEAEWMREDGAVAAFALRKCGKEFRNALAEIDWKAKDCAELDDDCVHLPVAVAEVDVEQGFGDAKMGGGADWNEFGETFDDAEDEGEYVVVQDASGCECLMLVRVLLAANWLRVLSAEILQASWSDAFRMTTRFALRKLSPVSRTVPHMI